MLATSSHAALQSEDALMLLALTVSANLLLFAVFGLGFCGRIVRIDRQGDPRERELGLWSCLIT